MRWTEIVTVIRRETHWKVHAFELFPKIVTGEQKSNNLVSICLILADKVISLCNWSVNPALGLLYFVDFFPHTITSCKRPALSCTKGGCLQENHRNSVNACQQILPG